MNVFQINKLFVAVLLSAVISVNARPSAVTYVLNGGRFGDQLITYIKAKWFAYEHNLPFLYVPFSYSDHLELSVLEQQANAQSTRGLNRLVFADEAHIVIGSSAGSLYVVQYETRLKNWNNWEFNMFPKIHDERFIQELRRCIKPRNMLLALDLPKDKITVALHVRKGGGFDHPLLTEQTVINKPINKFNYVDVDFPLKFPPDQYYIDQIRYLSELFEGQPLHIQLFTDDKNPQRLVDKYLAVLNKQNITFGYRKEGNVHNANVLEDFFGMLQCDCLIRSDSSFSRCAHIIGDFKVVIYPEHYYWIGRGNLIIDKVVVVKKD